MSDPQKLTLPDRAGAIMLDRNKNGRMDGDELITAIEDEIRKRELIAKSGPQKISVSEADALVNLTEASARERIKGFIQENAHYFACGIQSPSDTQLASFVNFAHAWGNQMRLDVTHPSAAAKADAAMASPVETAIWNGRYAVAMAEAATGIGAPPRACAVSRQAQRPR